MVVWRGWLQSGTHEGRLGESSSSTRDRSEFETQAGVRVPFQTMACGNVVLMGSSTLPGVASSYGGLVPVATNAQERKNLVSGIVALCITRVDEQVEQ